MRAPWFGYVPAALLAVVASSQLVLAQTAHLSAWVGGGFGMFASVDGRSFRHLHVIELGDGYERELFPPKELQGRVRRARSLPTDHNLRVLASALAERKGSDQAIRIEVWKTYFDPETLTPENRLLRGLTVAVSDS